MLHLLYGFLYRYNTRDTEESGLQNRVGTIAQTNLLRYLCRVDIIHFDIVVSKVFLHFIRHETHKFLALINGVEQECATFLQAAGHVVHMQVSLYMACHKVRRCNKVGGVNRFVTKTQVRARKSTGFLTIV